MCAGAIIQSRIPRVVVGCMNPKAGCAGSVLDLLHIAQFNHQAELETGVLEEECSQLMKQFFRELRQRKKEENTDGRIAVLIDKAKNILKKIKLKTIKAIKTKDTLKAKIDEIKTAIEDEPNKEMFRFLLEQFKLLLHEIKPVKQDINIHYGCEDPYITGKILVYASIFYGFIGIDMNITPDFEQEIIEGSIYLKGRIRIYKLLLIAFRVYRNDRFRKLVFKR